MYGTVDKRSGDTVVRAEIFPDFEAIREDFGEMSEERVHDFLKTVIEEANEQMPAYKRVKRFAVRNEEFEKTTTRKIKRYKQIPRED